MIDCVGLCVLVVIVFMVSVLSLCVVGILLFYGRGGGPLHAPMVLMKSLGWNCQGICNGATVNALRTFVKAQHLEIIFFFCVKQKP